ncbi:MAG: exo-alpha-sialidase [Anaerolineales bacterium]|nr:exo-alpha-sialidase [Anaerolineales bacterium]
MSFLSSNVDNLRPYFYEGVKIILFFFLVASGIIFILHSGLSIAHPYPLDYGEAPLVDQAMRMAKGENIYRATLDTPPYTIANYPPLYIVSLIPFLNTFASPFHMARAVSVVATLLSALFIGLTVYTFTPSYRLHPEGSTEPTNQQTNKKPPQTLPALVAALFFLASPYVTQWAGRARIDSLALAFATAALYVMARWPKSRWGWIGGGLLLVAAAYTRQSYALAAPLAGFVWLFTQDKRKAIGLALLVGGLGAALFFLLNTLTDGGFYYNIITANVNEFGWDRLKNSLTDLWNLSYIILLLGALFLLLGWRAQKSWPLIALFFVGASLSALTIGKIGSNINYYLELAAAFALLAGITLVWSQAHPWRYVAITLLLAVQMGLLLENSMRTNVDFILASRLADTTALKLLEQEVKDTDAPILADEYMGLLTINDRPLYLQPFEVTQLANAGMWNEQPLLDELAAQKFGAVFIHHFDTYALQKERWTPGMLAAIETYYRPVKTLAGTVIYIPRGETAIAPIPAPTQPATTAPVSAGSPIPVGTANFFAEPFLALNPTNPDHLVVVATRFSKQDCELPNCKVEMPFFSSMDGGQTWQTPATFSLPQQIVYTGQVIFDPEGTLYIQAKRNSTLILNQTTAAEAYIPSQGRFVEAPSGGVSARPWLQIDPDTGELFLTFDAQEGDNLFITPSLKRSTDGARWSLTARADQHVSATDSLTPRATGPSDIHVFFGEGNGVSKAVSLVWVWDPDPWTWPRTVWMANSTDNGDTFSEPTPLTETWGPISTASANGQFALVYRVGNATEQHLALATTSDNGQTWNSVIASGDVPLFFDPDHPPVLSLTPNGTLDLVFYAHDSGSTDCVKTLQSWQNNLLANQPDPCTYNVFYTFSKDGGLSFSEPTQLNPDPIQGENFPHFFGLILTNTYLSLAANDTYAYPLWLGTSGAGKTQIYLVKIER